ncbi:MAG: glycosyltransferase family 39 protein, partial [Chloroflexi bacterium]|nr:glycosyltransferase family 39 protein [Chloroflexota bacterium]
MIGRRLTLLTVILVAAGLHLLLWLPLPLILQTGAALILGGFLPGALLVEWLIGRSAAPPDPWERLLYSLAAGYGVMTLVMLGVSYWPGGVTAWQVIGTVDLLLLILLGFVWRVIPSHASPQARGSQERVFRLPSLLKGGVATSVAILVLLLIAGFLRLTHLGYAEFQGDEGRAVLRAAAVMQGYENVLFLHRKGPVEILLPTLLYALTGHLTETTARLPFALANLASVLAMFVLGRRLFNPLAGWVAALFLALDGYFIGFARIVQYQSIVILMSVLVVLILYRLLQRPAGLSRYLILAAFCLATGVLAHYEAALVIVPGLYLLWKIWQVHKPPGFILALGAALVVAGTAAGLFYLPYLLNPAFSATYAYLTDERIGGQFPYNNLTDFFLRTTLYDTTYAVLLLIGLAVLALLQRYGRTFATPWRWVASGFALLGLAFTFVKADWLTVGGIDYTFVFFLVLFGLVWFARDSGSLPQQNHPTEKSSFFQPTASTLVRVGWSERTLWLWFGALFLLSLFFTAKPRTHVYVFFLPWVLIGGMVAAEAWQALRTRWGLRSAGIVGGLAASLIVGVFGSYAYWYFVYNQVEIYRTWDLNH